MALPRGRTAPLLLLAFHLLLTFVAARQSTTLSLSNKKSSAVTSVPASSADDEHEDCFDSSTAPGGPYLARHEDCLNAINEVFHVRSPLRPVTFSRSRYIDFMLPNVMRSGSCVLSIDVMHDADRDKLKPSLVYTAARAITSQCTQGAYHFGGSTVAGPRSIVHVVVFGRAWPLKDETSEPVASESTVVAAGQRLIGREPTLLNETSLTSTEGGVARTQEWDKILDLNAPEPGTTLRCYDPPLPRERLWPIDVKDCEVATEAILKDRQRNQRYTFSRAHVVTSFYYHLPATFSHRSCVVHLDMNNNSDRDTVRLSIVEATAWVLAHKCSGEEESVEQYGGQGIVGVGSKGLINVWVYGRLWPPPIGATNMTNLILVPPTPLLESD